MDTNVKVYNRNSFDHVEKFKGGIVTIKANSFIEMDYEEANLFLGQMFPPKFDKNGLQKKESFKRLEIDQADKKKAELHLRNEKDEKAKRIFVCMACGEEFKSKKELLKHCDENHESEAKKLEEEDE